MIALLVNFIGAASRSALLPQARPYVYFDPRRSRFVAIFIAGLVVVCCAAVGNCRAADASASPEQLITGFANAPNINAAFYLSEAAVNNTAALRKAALAHLADKDPDTHTRRSMRW